jgi:hypothetical protein
MKMKAKTKYVLACSTLAAIVIAGTTSLLVSRPAVATPQFAKDTGKACGDCQTNPAGGGPLTRLGDKFKANGNKLPK